MNSDWYTRKPPVAEVQTTSAVVAIAVCRWTDVRVRAPHTQPAYHPAIISQCLLLVQMQSFRITDCLFGCAPAGTPLRHLLGSGLLPHVPPREPENCRIYLRLTRRLWPVRAPDGDRPVRHLCACDGLSGETVVHVSL